MVADGAGLGTVGEFGSHPCEVCDAPGQCGGCGAACGQSNYCTTHFPNLFICLQYL